MIKSNVKAVIRRLENFQSGFPAAVERTINPKAWQQALGRHARMAMEAVALPHEMRFLPGIESTLVGKSVAKGVVWQLSNPDPAGGTVPDLEEARSLVKGGHFRKGNRAQAAEMQRRSQQVERVRLAVREFVAAPESEGGKRRKAIDAGLTDEELADRLEWIMGIHPGQKAKHRTDKMESAGDSLQAAVERWMMEQYGGEGLTPDRAKVLFQAVALVWRQFYLDALPVRLRQELRKLWKDAGETLL
ncbi:MAG TPA: hypothetical protein VGH19_06715 [Verrucomicrobiae bacterium]